MYRYKGITRTQHHESYAFTCISIVHLGPPHIPLSGQLAQKFEMCSVLIREGVILLFRPPVVFLISQSTEKYRKVVKGYSI